MFNKFMLFVSSYIPLYILLIIKNILERITDKGRFVNIFSRLQNVKIFDEVNDWAICILLFTTAVSGTYLKVIIKKSGGNKKYKVIDVSDETGNIYFTYISIYLLSCMGLTLNSIVDCFVFLFVMLVVGYIYISNNMMYMNPVINLMGYKVYDCVLDSVNTNDKEIRSIVVMSKKTTIKVGEEITASGKQGFIFSK
jgi:hypothetical protein